MLNVALKILDSRLTSQIPSYATHGSAAMDLRACINAPLTLQPQATELIPSGFAIHLADPHYAALILPRSGLGHKHGLVMGNLMGLIDSDYQGEIKISLWNRSQTPYIIEPMERIAQLIIIPVLQIQWQVVQEFSESHRGEGGFGSTGR